MLNRDEVKLLDRTFILTDVDGVIRSMGGYKAPNLDGFQPVFSQACWEVVGRSVQSFALDFFETSQLPVGMNDALVVLIPKIEKP